MAYRGERTPGGAYGEYEWPAANDADQPVGAEVGQLADPDGAASASPSAPADPADAGISEQETARIPTPILHAEAEVETERIPVPTPPIPTPPTLTEAETARIPIPMLLTEAETARIPTPSVGSPAATPAATPAHLLAIETPPSAGQGLADLPTVRLPTAPPTFAPSHAPAVASSPAPTEALWELPTAPRRATGAPAGSPPAVVLAPPALAERPQRQTGGGVVARVGVVALLVALLLAVVGVGAAYAYGVRQSGAPEQAIGAYCAALRQANYAAVYALLAPAAQARIPRQQYISDGQARDQFYGRITNCQSRLVGEDGRFIFWRQPTLVVFTLTLGRAGAAGAHVAHVTTTGRVALAPSGAAWLVSAVDASLLGIDLDPLTVVGDFCQALIARDYPRAYGDLSAPLQHEQGTLSGFAKAFGAVGRVTACAEQLPTYQVAADDRSASLGMTLSVIGALPGGATTVAFTLPAMVTLTRTTQGWRIDTLALAAPIVAP